MSRILVALKDVPPRGDSGGRIELTWGASRPCTIEVQSSTGWHRRAGIEDFTETEVHEYQNDEELQQLLRIYTPADG